MNRISLAHLQNWPGPKKGKNYSGKWVPDLFPRPSPRKWWEHAIRSGRNVLAVSAPHSGQLNQIVKTQLQFWEPLAEQREREEHKSSNHMSKIWFKWLAWNCTQLLWQKWERKNPILQGKKNNIPFSSSYLSSSFIEHLLISKLSKAGVPASSVITVPCPVHRQQQHDALMHRRDKSRLLTYSRHFLTFAC